MLRNGYLSNMQPDLLQVDGTLTYDPLFANCGRAHTLCGSTLLGGGLGSYVRVGPCVAMTAAVEIASAWLSNQELVKLGYQAAGMIVKDKTCLSEEQPSWFILESNATLLDVTLEQSPEKTPCVKILNEAFNRFFVALRNMHATSHIDKSSILLARAGRHQSAKQLGDPCKLCDSMLMRCHMDGLRTAAHTLSIILHRMMTRCRTIARRGQTCRSEIVQKLLRHIKIRDRSKSASASFCSGTPAKTTTKHSVGSLALAGTGQLSRGNGWK